MGASRREWLGRAGWLGLAGSAAWAGLAASEPASALAQSTPGAWSDDEIRASRRAGQGAMAAAVVADKPWPGRRVDPLDLLLLIDSGASQVTLFDVQGLAPFHRFATRPGLLAEPVFSADGRHVYLASADGWIGQFDLWRLAWVAELRVGRRLQQIALSGDGRYLLAANQAPHSLVLIDADLQWVKTWPAAARDGRRSSAVDRVQVAARRSSFVVALQSIAELWLISYDPKVEDFYDGLVHDFRMGEGLPTRGFLNPRRIALPEPLAQLSLDPEAIHALGVSGPAGAEIAHAVNLDVRRRIASLSEAGSPQMQGSVAYSRQGRPVLVLPDPQRRTLSTLDRDNWRLLQETLTPAPVRALRHHRQRQELWMACSYADPARDRIEIRDAQDLRLIASIGLPGGGAATIAFSQDGRHALLCSAADPAMLWVVDCARRVEVARHAFQGPLHAVHLGQWLAGQAGTAR